MGKLAPLWGRFNSNRNGRIVELSCLYSHLFIVIFLFIVILQEGKLHCYVRLTLRGESLTNNMCEGGTMPGRSCPPYHLGGHR